MKAPYPSAALVVLDLKTHEPMEYFVSEDSIVRRIWGRGDTILLIFAGGAAEFALNKAVDWLYYTGKLPSDPIGRLFTTVRYAQRIVFAPNEEAEEAIQRMGHIHTALEDERGYRIPDWAYRDVLYLLIFYSIAAFELLERKLSLAEKEEVFQVFRRVGAGMGLTDLPSGYTPWLKDRATHLKNDLEYTSYTEDLFEQYRRQLGSFRYRILIEAQKLLVPSEVSKLLKFGPIPWLAPGVFLYKRSNALGLQSLIRNLFIPGKYMQQLQRLEQQLESSRSS